MPAGHFPSNPLQNQVYTIGSKTFRYNGTDWEDLDLRGEYATVGLQVFNQGDLLIVHRTFNYSHITAMDAVDGVPVIESIPGKSIIPLYIYASLTPGNTAYTGGGNTSFKLEGGNSAFEELETAFFTANTGAKRLLNLKVATNGLVLATSGDFIMKSAGAFVAPPGAGNTYATLDLSVYFMVR